MLNQLAKQQPNRWQAYRKQFSKKQSLWFYLGEKKPLFWMDIAAIYFPKSAYQVLCQLELEGGNHQIYAAMNVEHSQPVDGMLWPQYHDPKSMLDLIFVKKDGYQSVQNLMEEGGRILGLLELYGRQGKVYGHLHDTHPFSIEPTHMTIEDIKRFDACTQVQYINTSVSNGLIATASIQAGAFMPIGGQLYDTQQRMYNRLDDMNILGNFTELSKPCMAITGRLDQSTNPKWVSINHGFSSGDNGLHQVYVDFGVPFLLPGLMAVNTITKGKEIVYPYHFWHPTCLQEHCYMLRDTYQYFFMRFKACLDSPSHAFDLDFMRYMPMAFWFYFYFKNLRNQEKIAFIRQSFHMCFGQQALKAKMLIATDHNPWVYVMLQMIGNTFGVIESTSYQLFYDSIDDALQGSKDENIDFSLAYDKLKRLLFKNVNAFSDYLQEHRNAFILKIKTSHQENIQLAQRIRCLCRRFTHRVKQEQIKSVLIKYLPIQFAVDRSGMSDTEQAGFQLARIALFEVMLDILLKKSNAWLKNWPLWYLNMCIDRVQYDQKQWAQIDQSEDCALPAALLDFDVRLLSRVLVVYGCQFDKDISMGNHAIDR